MNNYRQNLEHEMWAMIAAVFIILGLVSGGLLLINQLFWWAL